MSTEEKIEGNELIAKFVGAVINKHYTNELTYCFQKHNVPTEHSSYNWSIRSMQYHSSWEWLFPIIDKINGMGKEYSIAIFKTYISLTVEKGGKVYKDFSFAHSEYITSEQIGKEAAFKLLVKFIKWYNEQQVKI